ncbi:hypothetical protein NA57DRAFT_66631 [Rhizodiscina lignyota]|uniref:Elongation factor 1 alpha-like protein n=1 Tax=Rhizodiscina lignyota TaxID=1504668 RepID=A0A9P4M8E6_9PEZI|nr:hypothetical protein NA57DRAFT_66631 [Rhizodiscina lignyota]
MAHRRVKNIDYDDDEVDDYDQEEYGQEGEGEELSPEDQEQMRQGTIKVREALGSDYQASDKVIQDALWNYYYDVGKSVSYIKNAVKPATPKKAKAKVETRFDKAASSAEDSAYGSPACIYHESDSSYQLAPRISFPFPIPPANQRDTATTRDFFYDVPWLHVPHQRLGHLSLVPQIPKGGLLGGSGKSSKLAALAAARRKKEEDKKTTSPSVENQSPDRAISLLDRLGKKDALPIRGSDSPSKTAPPEGRKISLRPKPAPVEAKEPSPSIEEQEEASPVESYPIANIKADPSTFAEAMLGLSRGDFSPSPQQSRNTNRRSSIKVHDFSISNAFSGPSPDDVVLTAQAKVSKNSESPAPSNPVSRQPSPPRKNRNINVLEEYERSDQKNAASFVVIGHVDHGKSTLMGRLLYDLKVVDQRSIDKLRREADNIGKSSFALAWVMDETSEERARGVTVDFATNYFETNKTRFTILDAPGHQDFIPNMIAGASQADFAVLVIDASTNSFESGLRGQTKEHALLVRSMGVQQLIIVINKMDNVCWSQQRFDEISQQMSNFLTSAGFQSKNITFVPCAGLTGENVVTPIKQETAPWYHGSCLVEVLDSMNASQRAISSPLRLTISDVFRGGTNNALSLTGRIDSGSLQAGEQIIVMPSGERASIRSLEADNNPAEWAVAGQIVTLHITDMDPVHLRTGDIVCSASSPIQNLTSFTAKILAFEHVMPMFLDVHRGPLHVPGKVTKLLGTLDKATGEVVKKKPRVVPPGAAARVEIEMEAPVPLEKGVRVVLRAEGQTVAAGLVE